jgi:predicted CXXCH cytochrome family protein
MRFPRASFAAFVVVGAVARAQTPPAVYVDSAVCAACHAAIARTYRQTGMGRSLSRPNPASTIGNYTASSFVHEPSGAHYSVVERGGKYYQRRFELGFNGAVVNAEEKQIDYIMGSGNHARTYLHRTAEGRLEELPLGWYAENGGSWGMNPGYDRPDHPGSRRAITYECMFCHNAYPKIPQGSERFEADPLFTGDLPLGIDCQRCHGPGSRHVQIAKTAGAKAETIRQAIVNPARLTPERQLETCMQCHLETTSFLLPHSIQRYERGPFSFRPGQPLSDFLLFFDHPPQAGKEDKFEIAGAAYRLRKSQCFLQSKGALQCTTCHNPHEEPHGEAATQRFTAACVSCHAVTSLKRSADAPHPPDANCTACHMPRRRTDDVVHVVMTDHLIERRPASHPIDAPATELHETAANAWRGPVVAYYPNPSPVRSDLYLAVAQVRQQNNLQAGIAALAKILQSRPSPRPEPYLELGDAWRDAGDAAKSIQPYQDALRRSPDWILALRKLAAAQEAAGHSAAAVASLQRALQLTPRNASIWNELGQMYLRRQKVSDAVPALQKALQLDADIPEAHNSLGILLAQAHDPRAESAFRNAIQLQPEYVEARANLASMLTGAQSAFEYERALQIQPADVPARLGYAEALRGLHRLDDAERQLRTAVELDPQSPDAHYQLGSLLEEQSRQEEAFAEYTAAVRVRPDFAQAHLALANLLIRRGEIEAAASHLRDAAKSPDPGTRTAAEALLRKLGK